MTDNLNMDYGFMSNRISSLFWDFKPCGMDPTLSGLFVRFVGQSTEFLISIAFTMNARLEEVNNVNLDNLVKSRSNNRIPAIDVN
jgi:hypothetical protein